jgi:hypothetical protein
VVGPTVELLADGSGEAGGENREEYLALMSKFDMALHLTPWDHHPTFVDGPIAPAWASPLHGVEEPRGAHALCPRVGGT